MNVSEENAIFYICASVVLVVWIVAAALVRIKTGQNFWPFGDSDD